MSEKSGFSWAINAVLFIGIIWGCIYFANQKDGQVTFGNVFSHGFKMTAVITVILLVWTLLSVNLLFPDMKDRALELARQRMEEKGKMSDSDIDKAIGWTKQYFTLFLVLGVLIGTAILGLIASLLGAAFAKKNQMNPLEQLDRLDQSNQ